jgi:arylsulfatase A-like enzyme
MRHLTLTLFFAIVCTALAGKPNIIFIMVDDLGKDWISCYGAGNPPSGERYADAYIHTRAGSKTYKGQFGPDVYCDFLVDFIHANKAKPMMICFPMVLTHGPLVPTPDEPKVTDKTARLKAMVHYTDKLVGRLVKAVDDADIRKNTIIIFTIGGVRPSGGKASNYEGGVCEPFIVNCPGIVAAGAETDALTDFSDLLPTFAELGGAPLPNTARARPTRGIASQ